MNSSIKSASLLAMTAALTISFSSFSAAQQTGPTSAGGNNSGPSVSAPEGGKSEPDNFIPRDLSSWNPGSEARVPPTRLPPRIFVPAKMHGESCAYLYHQITRENALATVPKYHECMRRHQTH